MNYHRQIKIGAKSQNVKNADHCLEKVSPQNQNMEQVITPTGLKMMLQPLDICINTPFKAKLKKQHIQCTDMMEHMLTATGKIKQLETEHLWMWIKMHGNAFQPS
jgi:hypothetical protein